MTRYFKHTIGTLIFAFFVQSVASAAWVRRSDSGEQNLTFKKYWGEYLEWRHAELPESGRVEEHRIPYCGDIYTDRSGGTAGPLRKYDRAFHRGRGSASAHEAWDIAIHTEKKRGFLFSRSEIPHWSGHCNGWTSAAIRHAQPQRNVVRNGVVFTPADIKGLLAEAYTFNDPIILGGELDAAVNPGVLHVIVSNWVGRKKYGIGMDSSVGTEIWNYPVYAYSSSSKRRSPRTIEVRMNLAYAHYIDYEQNRAPKDYRYLRLHYLLETNSKGQICGGQYFRDSDQIDLLWVPTKLRQGGTPGNNMGNPYVNIATLLSIWRDSVPAEVRELWTNMDDPKPEPAVESTPEFVSDESPAGEANPDSAEAADSETTADVQEAAAESNDEPKATEEATRDATEVEAAESTDGSSVEAASDEAEQDGDLVRINRTRFRR